MIYLDNNSDTQRVFIPRTNIEASAYHPSTGGTERYYAGRNIEITPGNIINVTGMTEAISTATSDFVTSGDVQSQITSQTQNFVTSGDVETMITAATSGFVETEALTAYTPTSGFATINGSAITEGGNIVIQGGGGDSTALEKITEFPESPVDGAIYNYKGILIKYVDGPGKWGEWAGFAQTGVTPWDSDANNPAMRNQYALNYTKIPSDLDGALIISFQYFTSSYKYFYFDLQNDCIIVKSSTSSTTVDYTIAHNGQEVNCIFSGSRMVMVSWFDNIINFNYGRDLYMDNILQPTASTAHYELFEEPRVSETSNVMSNGGSTPDHNYYGIKDSSTAYVIPKIIDSNGRVTQMGVAVSMMNPMFNGAYVKPLFGPMNHSRSVMPAIWAPTASGNVGELLVSNGQNGYNATPPVWKTIAQALGVDFWTGTQVQYDALATHSPTTLYIIIPS